MKEVVIAEHNFMFVVKKSGSSSYWRAGDKGHSGGWVIDDDNATKFTREDAEALAVRLGAADPTPVSGGSL